MDRASAEYLAFDGQRPHSCSAVALFPSTVESDDATDGVFGQGRQADNILLGFLDPSDLIHGLCGVSRAARLFAASWTGSAGCHEVDNTGIRSLTIKSDYPLDINGQDLHVALQCLGPTLERLVLDTHGCRANGRDLPVDLLSHCTRLTHLDFALSSIGSNVSLAAQADTLTSLRIREGMDLATVGALRCLDSLDIPCHVFQDLCQAEGNLMLSSLKHLTLSGKDQYCDLSRVGFSFALCPQLETVDLAWQLLVSTPRLFTGLAKRLKRVRVWGIQLGAQHILVETTIPQADELVVEVSSSHNDKAAEPTAPAVPEVVPKSQGRLNIRGARTVVTIHGQALDMDEDALPVHGDMWPSLLPAGTTRLVLGRGCRAGDLKPQMFKHLHRLRSLSMVDMGRSGGGPIADDLFAHFKSLRQLEASAASVTPSLLRSMGSLRELSVHLYESCDDKQAGRHGVTDQPAMADILRALPSCVQDVRLTRHFLGRPDQAWTPQAAVPEFQHLPQGLARLSLCIDVGTDDDDLTVRQPLVLAARKAVKSFNFKHGHSLRSAGRWELACDFNQHSSRKLNLTYYRWGRSCLLLGGPTRAEGRGRAGRPAMRGGQLHTVTSGEPRETPRAS